MTCEHDPLKEYDQQDLWGLHEEGQDELDCSDCDATFRMEYSHFAGEILLVRTEVENPRVEGAEKK